MPAGLQVQNWFKQSLTGGAFEALTPGTLDSNTFFNIPQGSYARLAEIWVVDTAHAGQLSLVASRFHDQVYAIRSSFPSGTTLAPASRMYQVSTPGIDQPIFPSDVLTVQVNATASDNVNCTTVLYYQDIPGISARLATYEEVMSRGGNTVGIELSLTPGSGNWGTSVALNSADNRLHANTDYAVLGFTATLPLSAVGLTGIDTGNLRTGGPVLGDGEHDSNLFINYARCYNEALIPIVNSNNAGATSLQAAGPGSSATVVTVQMVELDRNIGT